MKSNRLYLSEARGKPWRKDELNSQEETDFDAWKMPDFLLDHYCIPPHNIGEDTKQRKQYFSPNVGHLVVLKAAVYFEVWIDEGHEEVSIDVYEDACKADNDAYHLGAIDCDPVEVVVDDEDKERSSDRYGVEEREGKYKVHCSVYDLVDGDQWVPDN